MEKRDSAGFTLLELIIYTGILSIVGVISVAIFSQISRTYVQNQSKIEVVQNLRTASQIIQQAIQQASGINSASSTYLSLAMQDPAKDPTEFRLFQDAIERKEGAGSWMRITTDQVKVTNLNFSIISTQFTFIDQVNRWAWNGNGLGWIDFNPAEGNVRVPIGQGDFYGYAKAANAGYFSLNCQTPNDCTYPYKVSSDANGNLSGFAWNDLFGWVSFNCSNDHNPSLSGVQPFCAADGGYDYKVTIDTLTGDFSGWAWMPAFGWISFNCNNSGIGNTCATVSYKVTAQKQERFGMPINAVRVEMTIESDTTNPFARYNESYDFAVVLAQPAAVRVSSITPSTRQTCGTSCSPTINGSNFKTGAAVKLTRPGFPEIISSGTWTAAGGGTSLSGGTFDLSGAAAGSWDVWVINPDGQVGVLPDGFLIN